MTIEGGSSIETYGGMMRPGSVYPEVCAYFVILSNETDNNRIWKNKNISKYKAAKNRSRVS